MSLHTFQDLVDRCARERLDQLIANGSPAHARILISKLFETADLDVAIVTGKLTDRTSEENPENPAYANVDIYGWKGVVAQARKFLENPDAHLRVILAEGELKNGAKNSFLSKVVPYEGREGTISVFCPSSDRSIAHMPHFMVCDSYGFRYETKKDSTEAMANFGDRDNGRELREMFSDISEFIKLSDDCPDPVVIERGVKDVPEALGHLC